MLKVGAAEPALESWCRDELSDVELGDSRLNERLITTAERMLAKPQASLNHSCATWAETKAAYRFFANPRVEARDLLEPHFEKTQERMASRPVVLAVQDTTTVSFNHQMTQGLGPISTKPTAAYAKGLLVHSTLAITPQGLPLGLVDQDIWTRPEQPRPSRRAHKKLPITEKESFKWIKALKHTEAHRQGDETLVVMLGDREADIYELFLEAERCKGHYVVRVARDRSIARTFNQWDNQRLWETMTESPEAGRFDLEIKGRGGRAPRTATLAVHYEQVSFRPSKRGPGSKLEDLPRFPVWVIRVHELNPPAGTKALEWMLVTNVGVTSFDDAKERITWYSCRWAIEEFHRVLKSGLGVEDCRLETADRLERYLSLASIIAVRLFQLTHLARLHREAPCTIVLSETEWKALYLTMNKRYKGKIQKQVPTLYQAVRWIAQMGGFLARKCDGEPGVVTLWRGYTSLMDRADMIEAMAGR